MREPPRGDHAQMMLLTAFILLIGFVALAGMVARVSQLADETGQESRRGTILETAAVVDGVHDSLARLEAFVPPGDATETGLYMNAVDAAMEHMDALQSARGFRFEVVETGCADDASDTVPGGVTFPGDPDAVVWVRLSMSRADLAVEVTASHVLVADPTGTPVVPIVCP